MRKAFVTFCIGTATLLSGIVAPELLPTDLVARGEIVWTLLILAIILYALAGFFALSRTKYAAAMGSKFNRHVAWRFAREKPGHARPVQHPPKVDLHNLVKVEDLIIRIMVARGTPDDGSPEALRIAREVGQEIADQIALLEIPTWMRVYGTLDRVPYRVAKRGFGVGRNAAKEISCLTTYPITNDTKRNVTDIRFNKEDIRKVWADV